MDWVDIYNQAEGYYQSQEYQKALGLFIYANSMKESNDCLNYIGCSYLALGDYSSAQKYFEDLIQKCPDWERPVFNLGRVYLKLKENDKAKECFQKAEMLNPSSEDAQFYLGVYFSSIHDYESTKKYYQKSISLNYNQTETHLNLGMCYFREESFEEALEEFSIALNIDSTNYDALYDQGLAFAYMGNCQKAIEIFKMLYVQFPEETKYIREIANCYYKLKDYESTLNWNNKILELKPNDENALIGAEKVSNILKNSSN